MFDEKMLVFLRRRQIPLFGKIEVSTQSLVVQALFYLNALDDTEITLLIDSAGGNAMVGRIIGDVILNSKAPVTGLVIGEAKSAAFRVLQVCHRRQAYQNARLMFHLSTLEVCIEPTKIQKREKKRLLKAYEEMLHVIKKKSGQSLARLRKWGREERTFTGRKAAKLGLVDEVLTKEVNYTT